jgi:hypothetical protein
VGRTGDSSSVNAQSPFNRMGQHLGNAKNTRMLRNHLRKRKVEPEACSFRFIAHGPILPEAKTKARHLERRDLVAAAEKKLADDLKEAGYDVMNTVHCRKVLDEQFYSPIHAAFRVKFRNSS